MTRAYVALAARVTGRRTTVCDRECDGGTR